MSYGGFPLQMEAIGSLFDEMTLLIERGKVREGGLALPRHANIVVLPSAVGTDARRKLSVLVRLPYYLAKLTLHTWSADAVHTPVPGDMPLLAMLIALLTRKRLLARYGGAWFPVGKSTFMNRVTRGIMRRFAGGRNLMLATGDGTEPPGGKVKWVFSTALSQEELRGIEPSKSDTIHTNARLVYIGRLSPEKGVAVLIKAISILKKRGGVSLPKVTLIGDGPQRGALESLVDELEVRSEIRFVGQLDRSQLSTELTQADLCVQPSLTEGFSKAWLDAMAFGLPVVASNVGAASSVIGQAGERGWLVSPGDAEELADKLTEVISRSDGWKELRLRCREFVEKRTLEAWTMKIGEMCAEQWGMTLVEGKLQF